MARPVTNVAWAVYCMYYREDNIVNIYDLFVNGAQLRFLYVTRFNY